MTPKESLDGIIAGLRCGICPEGKMRDNPCHVCAGRYAAIERVKLLFEYAQGVAEALREHGEKCAGPRGTGDYAACPKCSNADVLERALRGERIGRR